MIPTVDTWCWLVSLDFDRGSRSTKSVSDTPTEPKYVKITNIVHTGKVLCNMNFEGIVGCFLIRLEPDKSIRCVTEDDIRLRKIKIFEHKSDALDYWNSIVYQELDNVTSNFEKKKKYLTNLIKKNE